MSLENIVPVADVAELVETQNQLTVLVDTLPQLCLSGTTDAKADVKCTDTK